MSHVGGNYNSDNNNSCSLDNSYKVERMWKKTTKKTENISMHDLIESVNDDDGRLRVWIIENSTSQLSSRLYTRR